MLHGDKGNDADFLDKVKQQLAADGTLRIGISLSNKLLVSDRDNVTGQPQGLSPDLGRAIAKSLNVPCEFVSFKGPGELLDGKSSWDIGNFANQPERAKKLHFSPPYCRIPASLLLRMGEGRVTSPRCSDYDRRDRRILTKARSAYCLWLEDHFENAELVKKSSFSEASCAFVEDDTFDALSGLIPSLRDLRKRIPGSIVIETPFTYIEQCVACKKGVPEAQEYLKQFIYSMRRSGLVDKLIRKHGLQGFLRSAGHVE